MAGAAKERRRRQRPRAGLRLIMAARRSSAVARTAQDLERPPGDAVDLALHMLVDDRGRCSSSHCLRIGRSISRSISSSGLTCGGGGALAATLGQRLEPLRGCRRPLCSSSSGGPRSTRPAGGERLHALVELEHVVLVRGFAQRSRRRAARSLLFLGDHAFDRRENIFHRGFTRLPWPSYRLLRRRSHALRLLRPG